MFTGMKKRTYRMQQRAESQAETRERIVEAAVALHESRGPRAASIKAIAEKAGVQRLTVYRHFPDDVALFQACTAHWLQRHPPPDPVSWQSIQPWPARVRAALSALYEYFRRTEQMWIGSFRDEADVPALQTPMRGFRDYLDAVRDDLLRTCASGTRPRAAVKTTLTLAVQFSTWQSLAAAGSSDARGAELVVQWLEGVLTPRG
jgi:AcrR family transcriptional regulator